MPQQIVDLWVHSDKRGSVRELSRSSWLEGRPIKQMNRTFTVSGALRGMHSHRIQTDVWSFVSGRAQVVLFDRDTMLGQSIEADEGTTLIIPPGVAHGFLAITDTILVYGFTEEYTGLDEYGFQPFSDDFPIAEDWYQAPYETILSERDEDARSFEEWLEEQEAMDRVEIGLHDVGGEG